MSRSTIFFFLVAGVAGGLLTPSGRKPPAPAQPQPQQAAQASSPDKPGAAVLETVIPRSPNGHFYVDAVVNGQMVHFMIDTGATSVVLTRQDAARVGANFSPDQFQPVARGASGDVMGQEININHIAIDQKEAFDLPALVVADGLDVSLLGQSFLARIAKVEINNDKMILS